MNSLTSVVFEYLESQSRRTNWNMEGLFVYKYGGRESKSIVRGCVTYGGWIFEWICGEIEILDYIPQTDM